MTTDLLIVAVLGSVWTVANRGALAGWWRSRAAAAAGLRELRSPVTLLLLGAVLVSSLNWIDAARQHGLGPLIEAAQGGVEPEERRYCRQRQGLLESGKTSGIGGSRPVCPFGGGLYLSEKEGYSCPRHGRSR